MLEMLMCSQPSAFLYHVEVIHILDHHIKKFKILASYYMIIYTSCNKNKKKNTTHTTNSFRAAISFFSSGE